MAPRPLSIVITAVLAPATEPYRGPDEGPAHAQNGPIVTTVNSERSATSGPHGPMQKVEILDGLDEVYQDDKGNRERSPYGAERCGRHYRLTKLTF